MMIKSSELFIPKSIKKMLSDFYGTKLVMQLDNADYFVSIRY